MIIPKKKICPICKIYEIGHFYKRKGLFASSCGRKFCLRHMKKKEYPNEPKKIFNKNEIQAIKYLLRKKGFTKTKAEIVVMVLNEHTTAEIEDRMCRSIKTVKWHLGEIYLQHNVRRNGVFKLIFWDIIKKYLNDVITLELGIVDSQDNDFLPKGESNDIAPTVR